MFVSWRIEMTLVKSLYSTHKTLFRIRVRMDQHWFWSSGSGGGPRRAKMIHKNKKILEELFWRAVGSVRAEGFSWNWNVLCVGLGIS
jgi:hypothetical protein